MRRAVTLASALIALAFALDTALWALTTSRLAGAFARMQEGLRDDGWRVSAAAPVRGGWPFQAMVSVAGVSLEGGARILPGGLAFRAEHISLALALLHPRTLLVLPAGQCTLRVSHAPPLVFSADALRAALPIGEGRPHSLDLQAASMVAGLAGSAHPRDVRIGHLSLHLSDREKEAAPAMPSADIRLSVSGLDLPDTRQWPLGARIASIGLAASLTSPATTLAAATPEAQARSWRDGGGRLSLQDIALHWGPLEAGGAVALRLDQRLQPAGSGHARLAGYAAALDALAGGGAISEGLATTVKAVLGLMAPVAGDGAVSLPFALKDNTLSVGKIPLVRLSDIVWKAKE